MTDHLRIDAARLRHDLEQVAQYGATGSGGVSRTSFSDADKRVRAWLTDQCDHLGLPTRVDGIGNVFIRVDAPDAAPGTPPVCTGSHLDSVPDGGRFDGALGSLAALEVARRITEEHVPLRRPVEVVVFADEEGDYHHLCGSSALVRDYTVAELGALRGRDGDLLVDALAGMGWDPVAATSTAIEPGSVAAFVELHIEQGAVLESRGVDIGVVTGIVGLGGGELEFTGRQDHAGTTPMTLRRDASRGAGEMLVRLPEVARSVSDTAVITCGILGLEPGGSNVVPRVARLCLDFRDPDSERVFALEEAIVATAREVAARHDLEVRYSRESVIDPAPLDTTMRDLIDTTATGLGLSTLRLPSGAGHDSQNMASLAPTGMIFVPSVGGVSHSPAEYSRWEDVANGANVLLNVVLALVTE